MKNEELKNKKRENKKSENKDKVTNKKKVTLEEEVIEVESKEVIDEENTYIDNTIVKEENNKKLGDIFLIVGLALVLVLGFFVMGDVNAGPSYELPLTLSGDIGLQELTYKEYKEKIDNDESFVLIIERETCSHCQAFLPVAESFAKDNNLPMYYVDTDTFTSDEWATFEKTNSYLKKANGDWGTPTTVVLAGYDAVDYLEGAGATEEELLDLYNKYFDMNKE